MLYTIIAVDGEERSFRGLLYVGAVIPENLVETSKAMQFHDAVSPGRDLDGLVTDLKDHICFVLADDPRLIEQLKTLHFKLYRCTELSSPFHCG